MESLEYKGLWWLPESPDDKFSGVLTFHPIAGGILAVEGGFNLSSSPSPPIEFSKQFPGSRFLNIVVGKSDKPITLAGLTWISTSYSSNTFHFYRVDIVYANETFERRNDLLFDRIDIVCDQLKMTDTRFPHKEMKAGPYPDVTFFLPGFDINCHNGVPDPRGSKEQRSLFRFRLKDPLPYEVFEQRILQPCLHFWTLVMGEPIVPLALYSNNGLFDGGEHPDRRIEIYRAFHRSDDHKQWFEKIQFWYFVLDYKDIAGDIQQVLQTWYTMHAQCRPVFDLYFDAVQSGVSSPLHTQNLFLTYCRVIEGYHRVFHGGEFFNDENYKPLYTALMQTIAEALPEDYHKDQRKHLEDMLRSGQAYSLGRRLEELIALLIEPYREIVHDYVARDVRAFTDTIQKARKELLNQAEITRSPSEMKYLARALNIIIRLCVAHRLGFPVNVTRGIAVR